MFGLMALAISVYETRELFRIDAGYADLLEKDAAAALHLTQANRSLQAARASIGDMMMARSKDGKEHAEASLKEAQDKFVSSMDLAIAALPAQADLPPLKTDGFAILTTSCGAPIAVGRTANDEASIAMVQQLFLGMCQPAFAAISPRFQSAAAAMIDNADSKRRDVSARAYETSKRAMAGAVIALAAVLVLGVLAIRMWIVKPIGKIAGTMTALADGDLSAIVQGTDRRDELGIMARSVQIFKDNGLRARDLERDVEAGRAEREHERERSEATERQRVEEMRRATKSLAEGLQHLASGNLTFRLDAPFTSDLSQLRADFNAAGEQLASSLGTVAAATAAIDGGAAEISQSAQDLSRRTERQAASLEETAAALDQVTQKVSMSSKRTEEARRAAIEANESARSSSAVMSKTIFAMQGIEGSSNEIANIIGVIDEIAFQTNLLALNAGVEASRAGEAGKGFAVVAQEVRELAQRSARAAKEIKELIGKSVSEVEAGVKLVQDTGQLLATIEQQVAVINSQLEAVATSAKEQSAALAEINSAVNQMDQVTQQNASMAEQCTSASTALAAEVGRLREIVSEFRLELDEDDDCAPDQTASFEDASKSPVLRLVSDIGEALGHAGGIAER
ncbi:methyl-accepting chemotaxis protein [Rhizobium sp. CCGE531]|nr:methyl-accepting chemotaxis protein [Rhizobium sp. CCGE531]AYG74692.1 methyl-accepting chemotaxis protein [Rhizobium sp. CCGE532]